MLFDQFGNSVMIVLMFVSFLLLRWALKYLVAGKPTKLYLLGDSLRNCRPAGPALNFISTVKLISSLRDGLASHQIPGRLMSASMLCFAFPISDFVTVQLPKLSLTPLRTEYMPFLLPWHFRLSVI